MTNSNRAPLLPRRAIESHDREEPPRSESTLCIFDRICNPLATIFSKRNLAIASGPLATLLVFGIAKYHGFSDGTTKRSSDKIGAMLGALVWMALWWMLEPIPIAITSLLPLSLFPLFGIMASDEVALEYMNDVVILMLGSFILALGITRYGLHKRLALKILLLTGGEGMDPRLVLLGLIIGPGFISMWMSNTSTAAMMVPMATGLLGNLHPDHHMSLVRTKSEIAREELNSGREKAADSEGGSGDERLEAIEAIRRFSQGVILGVTYGIAIGGMGTLIGCGPDVVLPGIYHNRFPDAPRVTFLNWMKFAVPLVLLWAVPLWLYLCWQYSPAAAVPMIEASLNRAVVESAYDELGPITFAEKFICGEFTIVVLLWVTRSFGESPGWGVLFNNLPGDGTVALTASILLFTVPNFQKDGEMLMDWKTCKNISWNVLLLLGGGFALSRGIQSSGLSTWISLNLEFFNSVPYYLLTPVLAIMVGIITEFSSNAATATLFLPIFAELAVTINVHPLLLMIPATFASNYAFVLPSGTPPNAIAIGTGYVAINDMAKPGLFMKVTGIIILSILTPTLGAYVFGLNVDASEIPWLGK